MSEKMPHRLRLKLSSGAELEAEGDADFVRQERAEFLMINAAIPAAGAGAAGRTAEPRIDWGATVELKPRGGLCLRAKLPGDASSGVEACLVLIMASELLLRQSRPTAAMLAKWLRISGYPVGRVDRLISPAIERGELLSSGSRRSRRYELTATGKMRALLLAETLSGVITGPRKP
jgi:hypothetical protein